MATLEPEYRVECLGTHQNLWYFVSRLHGLTRAVELAAVMREVKGHPARVVPVAADRKPECIHGVGLCTGSCERKAADGE